MMEQAIPKGYTSRLMEIIGEINGVIGELQRKLSVILVSGNYDPVASSDEDELEFYNLMRYDLNTDLKLVLLSLQGLNRRIKL